MEEGLSDEQSFSDLYGYFCGMLIREKMEDIYGWMMGAIPDLGSVKGDINLAEQAGGHCSV
ncbi:hypothetical protein AALB39_03225 [Lachnospiraceae bacterium 54-53]